MTQQPTPIEEKLIRQAIGDPKMLDGALAQLFYFKLLALAEEIATGKYQITDLQVVREDDSAYLSKFAGLEIKGTLSTLEFTVKASRESNANDTNDNDIQSK